VIVTGSVTGQAPKIEDVREARAHSRLPVVLGSGVDADNLPGFFPEADGFIVGSHFKADGHWANAIDPKRVERFVAIVRKLRGG
jgi:predicted TIM-barrel enzyme